MKRKLTILDKRGMTLTEMIVALGLLALLIAIFAPYFAQQLSMLVEAGQLNERAMENAYRLEQGLAENRISPDTRLVPVKYLSEDTAPNLLFLSKKAQIVRCHLPIAFSAANRATFSVNR
jgi:prepilin-type N-terminal cleavage/methylation domain-containing protein